MWLTAGKRRDKEGNIHRREEVDKKKEDNRHNR